MKRPLFSHPGHRSAARQPERGVTIVLVAVAMVAMMAIAALSIDVVTLYLANAEMQRAADTAAISAARILSITGMTGDPNNSTGNWTNACNLATQVATAVAQQNTVSGAQITTAQLTVRYPNNSDPTSCTGASPQFGVNPLVSVKVQRTDLPTFFAHIFGLFNSNWSSATVSATGTAEAFNPSFSNTAGNGSGTTTIPVQPRCVKPWVIPNIDPRTNSALVSVDGNIVNTGIGGTATVGETFWLVANCGGIGGVCQPGPVSAGQYVPAETSNPSVAMPSCPGSGNLYETAISGCDQTTLYQCGVKNGNTVDLAENPSGPNGDTANGAECLIHQSSASTSSGEDQLDTTVYPYQILAGTSNPLVIYGGLSANTIISGSNSIVSFPIYDNNAGVTFTGGNEVPVTIVGFLQAFINNVDTTTGNVNVTVLNVAGCGNGTNPIGNPVTGSSPVPVRLVQQYQ